MQNPKIIIRGTVHDYVSDAAIPCDSMKAEILRSDSSFVSSLYPRKSRENTLVGAGLEEEGDYILHITHPDYHPLYQPVKVKYYKRDPIVELGKIRLKKRLRLTDMQTLDEVTVTATKIQFYFKKDTLVYNASTFVTQHGLVLNDILKKMPGLTITKDGEIFSNGRKVENLLLNGKDFFDSDRKTLLANLPAFMVKDVQVYHKDKDTTSTFLRERELEGLTMNVRLKPDYRTSFIGNAEMAYGTSNHYYGRLFGMRINDNGRLSFYAGANDVNRNEEMSQNGNPTNRDNGIGEKDFYNAGMNYNFDDPRGNYSLQGKMRLQGSKELSSVQKNVQNFYEDGDVYALSHSEQRSRNLSVQTDHRFELFQHHPWSVSIQPAFSYVRSKNKLEQLQATFDRNVADTLGIHWRDSLRTADMGETLRAYGINRTNLHEDKPVSMLSSSLALSKRLPVLHSQDHMLFAANAFYNRETSEDYTHRAINYIRQGQADWRNTYNDILAENSGFGASAEYVYDVSPYNNHKFAFKLSYDNSRNSTNDAIYNLHALQGDWASPGLSPALGLLPSQVDMLGTMDASNSKRFVQHINKYVAQVNFETIMWKHMLNVTLPLQIVHGRLNFFQNLPDPNNGSQNYAPSVSRTLFRPDLRVSIGNILHKRTGVKYSLGYNLENSLPTLIYLIDQRNDANPLYVYEGNTNLKGLQKHALTSMVTWSPSMMHNHRLLAVYSYQHNATSMSTLLDKSTGGITYTPKNVDGNQVVMATMNNEAFLSSKYTYRLTNSLTYLYTRSVDYSGASLAEQSARSVVNNHSLVEALTFSYQNPKRTMNASLTPRIKYNHFTSTRENFSSFHAFEYGVEAEVGIELPKDFRITTNAQSVSRRGYNSSEMNDNEIIWNATLSKAFKKGWKLSLEGTDLLGQYKNVVRYVNAQGRTESMYNHLGRYAMLHVVYQFNTKNKKKQ